MVTEFFGYLEPGSELKLCSTDYSVNVNCLISEV